MSEVKVRVWDGGAKKMLYFHELSLTECHTAIAAQEKTFEIVDFIDTFTSKPSEERPTMLFSGFEGIWESDVLKGEAPTGVVRFGIYDNKKDGPEHQQGSGFYLETRDGISSLSQLLIDLYKYKVIGNICDKPELLKLCSRQ